MIKTTTGPAKTAFSERLRFAPVRVSAALRHRGDEPAQALADHIDGLLGSLSERAEAQVPAGADWGPRPFAGRTIRVTPGLLQAMSELDLLLELNGMISESLAARPEWADLRELLW